MRIKNFKMFLESLNTDGMGEEEKNHIDEMKAGMMKAFEKLFIVESLVRPLAVLSGEVEELGQVVDQIITTLVTGVSNALMENESLPQDIKLKVTEGFSESVMKARPVMINESFKVGMDQCMDEFINIIIGVKKAIESEGEEWKEEKVKEYEDMSDVELRKLIDIALDDKDFGKVAKLSSFLTESVDMEIGIEDPEVLEAIDGFIYELVTVIVNYFNS